MRQSQKRYEQTEKGKATKRRYVQTEKRRIVERVRHAWLKAQNPEQTKAQKALQRAVKRGKLIRPAQCERCGKVCIPHGHHVLGYAKEHWLTVEWLCLACHRHAHGVPA